MTSLPTTFNTNNHVDNGKYYITPEHNWLYAMALGIYTV